MPLQDFDGQTWVAFSDLCGTKEKIRQGHRVAARALSNFYNTVYNIHEETEGISALVVSDNAVLWLHSEHRRLDTMLGHVKRLHHEMVRQNLLLRTSLAFGRFEYQQRIQLHNLTKGMVFGGAYVAAYIANHSVKPGAIVIAQDENQELPADAGDLAPYLKPTRKPRGWEFFWWIDSPDDIERAEQHREQEVKDAPFAAFLRAYRRGTQRGSTAGNRRGNSLPEDMQ